MGVEVNPACAGMILVHLDAWLGLRSKPRVCGDDPAERRVGDVCDG